MEGVPRIPMLAFPVRRSADTPIFKSKLQKFIVAQYGESPDSYSKEIHELESLRASAIHATRDYSGCATLKKYYCQLHFLKSRFPLSEGSPISVNFSWYDIFSDQVHAWSDIEFEISSVLFNIGALHSEVAGADSRTTVDDMKNCVTHYQCAAWAFEHLRSTYHKFFTPDMSSELLSLMSNVCLAQAQECVVEKSLVDNRRSVITTKLLIQIVDFYQLSLRTVEVMLKDASHHTDKMVKALRKWKKMIDLKIAYYSSLTYLYRGQQAEDQKQFGERVTFYKAALEKVEYAIKLVKTFERTDGVHETLSFVLDVIVGKATAAQKDNEFIYHEKVPPIDSITETIKGLALVKPIPLKIDDASVSGPDIFARLVPMEAHEASSLYSEEKAKLLRHYSQKIEEKDQTLQKFLLAMQLENLKIHDGEATVPQELVDCCAAMNGKPDAVKKLVELMGTLSGKFFDVDEALGEIKRIFETEDVKEAEYGRMMGKRPPSNVFVELRHELEKYEKAHNLAKSSNETLREAVDVRVKNLRILMKPLSELTKHIPSPKPIEAKDMEAVTEMRRLAGKVDEMQKQRIGLISDLRDALQHDDITQNLVVTQETDTDALFQREIGKHNKITQFIDQNLLAQENIIRALTEANARYSQTREETMQVITERQSVVQAMIDSYEAYDELLSKCSGGIEFYKKLEESVMKLLTRAKGVAKVQDEEREDKMGALHPLPHVPQPTYPPQQRSGTVAGGSKLKDYLAHRKPNDPQVALPTPQTNFTPSAPFQEFQSPYAPTPQQAPSNQNPAAQFPANSPRATQFSANPPSLGPNNQNFSAAQFPANPAPQAPVNNQNFQVAQFSANPPHSANNQHFPAQFSSIPPSQATNNPHFQAQSSANPPPQASNNQNFASAQFRPNPPSQSTHNQNFQPAQFPAHVPSQAPNNSNQPVQFPTNPPQAANNQNFVPAQFPANPPPQGTNNPSFQSAQFPARQYPPSVSQAFTPSTPFPGYQSTFTNYQPAQATGNNPNFSASQFSPSQYPSIISQANYAPKESNYGGYLPYTSHFQSYTQPTQQSNSYYAYNNIPTETRTSQSQIPGTGQQQQAQEAQEIKYPAVISQANYAPKEANPPGGGYVPYSTHFQSYTQPTQQSNAYYAYNNIPTETRTSQSQLPGSGQVVQPQESENQLRTLYYSGTPSHESIPANQSTPSLQPIMAPQSGRNIDLLTDIDLSAPPVTPLLPPTNYQVRNDNQQHPQHHGEFREEEVVVDTEEVKGEEALDKVDPLTDTSFLAKLSSEMDKLLHTIESFDKKSLNGPTNLDTKWREVLDLQNAESGKKSISVARCYPMKNRYPDILPFDQSRVSIPSTKDEYINATLLGKLSPLAVPYIITQLPLPSTYGDFWHMVFDQGVELIASLLGDQEQDHLGHVYYPRSREQELLFPPFRITLQSLNRRQGHVQRIFSLQQMQTKVNRVVIQLQFNDWGAGTFPTTPASLLAFVAEVHSFYDLQRNHQRPVVLHCLAGVGRSGIFVTLSAAMREITQGNAILDLAMCAGGASAKRKGILIDREYLRYTYHVLLYFVQNLLVKRGVSPGGNSTDEKARNKHRRHPSQDFLDDPFKSLLPSITESLKNEAKAHSLTTGDEELRSLSPVTNSSSISQQDTLPKVANLPKLIADLPLALTNLDPSTFKPKAEPGPTAREVFESGRGSLLNRTPSDDPLSSLDPLWTLQK